MNKADVKIGCAYRAKVSDKLTDVRIDAVSPHGGWDATNLATNKKLRIKSARRLRGRATAATSKTRTPARAATAASGAKGTAKATGGVKVAKAATPAKQRKHAGKSGGASGGATKKRKGILAIAAEFLAKAKEPMGCKDIVEQAIAKKLWSTRGKTPQATLYAAIIREIATKGKDARFVKAGRGTFRLRKGA